MHPAGLAAFAARDPARQKRYSFENRNVSLAPAYASAFRDNAKDVGKNLMAAAEVMPADKFGFNQSLSIPTPVGRSVSVRGRGLVSGRLLVGVGVRPVLRDARLRLALDLLTLLC